MNDKTKEFIHTALVEYTQLRSEIRDMISRQFLIISLTITILGTLFGYSISKNNKNIEYIYLLVIPCFSAFSGILWLDCTYRQVKLGTYVAQIEKKINALFVEKPGGDFFDFPLYWEHYADNEARAPFFKIVNHWLYYFSLAFYLLMPIISFIYAKVIIRSWNLFGYFSLLIYVCFIIFMVGYCYTISNTIKMINNNDKMCRSK